MNEQDFSPGFYPELPFNWLFQVKKTTLQIEKKIEQKIKHYQLCLVFLLLAARNVSSFESVGYIGMLEGNMQRIRYDCAVVAPNFRIKIRIPNEARVNWQLSNHQWSCLSTEEDDWCFTATFVYMVG